MWRRAESEALAARRGPAAPPDVANLVRTAAWPGWGGHGYLIATDGRIYWAPAASDEAGASSIDLRELRDCDVYERCLYLASVLDVAVVTVAEILRRPRDLYGPETDAVRGLLRACGAWGSVPADPTRAVAAVRCHLQQLPGRSEADPDAMAISWGYPAATAGLGTHTDLIGRWTRTLGAARARARTDSGSAGSVRRAFAAGLDARRLAREVVESRSGPAWPWRQTIDVFALDVELSALQGFAQTPNPMAPLRDLYRMGISFVVTATELHLLASARAGHG
jgi:hypothetical protein